MKGYYSVFNPQNKKIADCGSEKDAVTLMHMRNSGLDGHYYQFNPLPGDIINVTTNKLPPNQKYIGWKDVTSEEFDVEFGKFEEQKLQLRQSELQKLDL